eukprot:1137592-Pyramimonas_sp.AAC.1
MARNASLASRAPCELRPVKVVRRRPGARVFRVGSRPEEALPSARSSQEARPNPSVAPPAYWQLSDH